MPAHYLSATAKGGTQDMEHRMSTRFQLAWLVTASAVCLGTPAIAQDTVKIGELNSYKGQPAFLEPYKKGWEFAVEEINAKSGVLGKKLELVSRDDGANPGDAVRAANELVTREGTNIIAGTFLSNIGLAVTEFAGKEKVARRGTDPIKAKRQIWFRQSGVIDAAIYDRKRMPAGLTLAGPVVIESLESTILVPPGWHAIMDEHGFVLLTRLPQGAGQQ